MLKIILVFLFLFHPVLAENWELLDENPFGTLRVSYIGMSCYDSNNYIAFGNYNDYSILCRLTSDGGDTWETITRDTIVSIADTMYYKDGGVRDAAYPDSNLIILTCDSGFYWRTTDRGMNWEINKLDCPFMLRTIDMLDSKVGAVASPNWLFLTTDGGKNWKDNYYLDSMEVFIDLNFISDSIIIALCYSTHTKKTFIMKTRDFGTNWERYSAMQYQFGEIYFFDEYEGFAVARPKVNTNVRKDVLYHTKDGGQTWQSIIDTIANKEDGLRHIRFADRNNGIVLGYKFKMYRTKDGGESWKRDYSFDYAYAGDYFSDVAYPDTNNLLGCVLNNAKIFRFIENPVAVYEKKISPDNLVYPNPINRGENLNLHLSDFNKEMTIEMYSLLGVLTFRFETKDKDGLIEIKIPSEIHSGSYYLRIGQNNKKCKIIPLIIE